MRYSAAARPQKKKTRSKTSRARVLFFFFLLVLLLCVVGSPRVQQPECCSCCKKHLASSARLSRASDHPTCLCLCYLRLQDSPHASLARKRRCCCSYLFFFLLLSSSFFFPPGLCRRWAPFSSLRFASSFPPQAPFSSRILWFIEFMLDKISPPEISTQLIGWKLQFFRFRFLPLAKNGDEGAQEGSWDVVVNGADVESTPRTLQLIN